MTLNRQKRSQYYGSLDASLAYRWGGCRCPFNRQKAHKRGSTDRTVAIVFLTVTSKKPINMQARVTSKKPINVQPTTKKTLKRGESEKQENF